MRELFVTDLVRDILGPRRGIHEKIRDPLNEYVTGVLAPITREAPPDAEAQGEVAAEETQSYEEETGDAPVSGPPGVPPPLRPEGKPSSIGLSFTVESEGLPAIDVCLTWARYFPEKEGWFIRKPRCCVLGIKLDKDNLEFYIDGQGRVTTEPDASTEVCLSIRVRQLNESKRMVTLHLINSLQPQWHPERSETFRTEDHIFQPQIRVLCGVGVRIVALDTKVLASDEEQSILSFLYRNKPVLARGHLCAAIWKEVDPQRDYQGRLDFPDCRQLPPFGWPDGETLPEEQRRKFALPDVRTEFVPAVMIPMPDLTWPIEYGTGPELRALPLAEAWEPERLRSFLEPLINGYRLWIRKQEENAADLSEPARRIANRLLDECREALERMEAGLNFLCSDEDARLAFCFANMAMDLQWRWDKNTDFVWWPFQLAFLLMTVEPALNRSSRWRGYCDLLWVPTGAGKTEAYIGVALMVLAYRRRRALRRTQGDRTGAGVTVITRYTLRLLTVQQFRRLLRAITACEVLRVWQRRDGGPVGWRPNACSLQEDYIWGSTPFCAGLWVGGAVTPNRLQRSWTGTKKIPGAIQILDGESGEGEPAQVLNCPSCNSVLAIGNQPFMASTLTLHLVAKTLPEYTEAALKNVAGPYSGGLINVTKVASTPLRQPEYRILTLELSFKGEVRAEDIDRLGKDVEKKLGVRLACFRASRPGYFPRTYTTSRGRVEKYDFEIFCPNPQCPLIRPWSGGCPAGRIEGRGPDSLSPPAFPDGNRHIEVPSPFRANSPYVSDRIPVPALTVDEQIYHRIPSVLVATVDKLARLAFEPRASAIFGNVMYHDPIEGYYRPHATATRRNREGHPSRSGRREPLYVKVSPLDPPDLVLQDEMHLIEGPLGSMVGFYETAVDYLCQGADGSKVYYIASTATIRSARDQVLAVIARELRVFPPPGLTIEDRFFLRTPVRDGEPHQLDDGTAGRLYLGVCAPGKGPLTPLKNLMARLLQTAWELQGRGLEPRSIDPFWTLTLYFNSIRELGGARSLYRQDVRERIRLIAIEDASSSSRELDEEKTIELSSRTGSNQLPVILKRLENQFQWQRSETPDSLFTTSMFGTGVDIPRLSLMIVDGQPKTTTAYIQSTGRVGRMRGGLVVVFLRATRPRDLNHYEFFVGYHQQLHRFVEPPSVAPFCPGVVEKAGGALAVLFLRNARNTQESWYPERAASLMKDRKNGPDVARLKEVIGNRVGLQPEHWRQVQDSVLRTLDALLDRWWNVAAQAEGNLAYTGRSNQIVVLGDPYSKYGHRSVFPDSPISLRGMEETVGLQDGIRRE